MKWINRTYKLYSNIISLNSYNRHLHRYNTKASYFTNIHLSSFKLSSEYNRLLLSNWEKIQSQAIVSAKDLNKKRYILEENKFIESNSQPRNIYLGVSFPEVIEYCSHQGDLDSLLANIVYRYTSIVSPSSVTYDEIQIWKDDDELSVFKTAIYAGALRIRNRSENQEQIAIFAGIGSESILTKVAPNMKTDLFKDLLNLLQDTENQLFSSGDTLFIKLPSREALLFILNYEYKNYFIQYASHDLISRIHSEISMTKDTLLLAQILIQSFNGSSLNSRISLNCKTPISSYLQYLGYCKFLQNHDIKIALDWLQSHYDLEASELYHRLLPKEIAVLTRAGHNTTYSKPSKEKVIIEKNKINPITWDEIISLKNKKHEYETFTKEYENTTSDYVLFKLEPLTRSEVEKWFTDITKDLIAKNIGIPTGTALQTIFSPPLKFNLSIDEKTVFYIFKIEEISSMWNQFKNLAKDAKEAQFVGMDLRCEWSPEIKWSGIISTLQKSVPIKAGNRIIPQPEILTLCLANNFTFIIDISVNSQNKEFLKVFYEGFEYLMTEPKFIKVSWRMGLNICTPIDNSMRWMEKKTYNKEFLTPKIKSAHLSKKDIEKIIKHEKALAERDGSSILASSVNFVSLENSVEIPNYISLRPVDIGSGLDFVSQLNPEDFSSRGTYSIRQVTTVNDTPTYENRLYKNIINNIDGLSKLDSRDVLLNMDPLRETKNKEEQFEYEQIKIQKVNNKKQDFNVINLKYNKIPRYDNTLEPNIYSINTDINNNENKLLFETVSNSKNIEQTEFISEKINCRIYEKSNLNNSEGNLNCNKNKEDNETPFIDYSESNTGDMISIPRRIGPWNNLEDLLREYYTFYIKPEEEVWHWSNRPLDPDALRACTRKAYLYLAIEIRLRMLGKDFYQ